jgi:hypothetical protein
MLRRRTGGWLLDEEERTYEVPDDEVYRWYQTVSEAQFDLRADPLPADGFEAAWTLLVATSPEDRLELSCGEVKLGPREGRWACARDRAQPRLLLGEVPAFSFDSDTLADRRVLRFAVADVRSLELMGGRAVRQALRQDLGVWRLDAPEHPDGDGALDQVRIENILGSLSSLRADEWLEGVTMPLQREWRVQVAPGGSAGQGAERVLRIHEGCEATVEGLRAFRLGPRACEILGGDLFFDDPLRHWLRASTTLQVRDVAQDQGLLLRRSPDGWRAGDGSALGPVWAGRMQRWMELRSAGLRAGAPPGPPIFEFDLQRTEAAPVRLSLGEGWLGIDGSAWWYELEAAKVGVSGDAPP